VVFSVINLPSGAEAYPIEPISIGTAEAVPFQSRSFEMVRLPCSLNKGPDSSVSESEAAKERAPDGRPFCWSFLREFEPL
jgi:hypothetical protein